MEETVRSPRLIRFGTFELDLQSGELRKSGVKLRLTGLPFQVLAILLERPGAVVTREELQKRLWPDTFVDVDHSLNTSVNKIREVLGDSAESPRFVETLPRRGYRFIAPVEGAEPAPPPAPPRGRFLRVSILIGTCVLLLGTGFLIYRLRKVSEPPRQRTLTRVTFDDGLQIGATWSPDGRFLAFSSDRGGKFDIWVQQVSGGDPIQVTKGPGQNWQPDWSPDGKFIAYRSEDEEGGLYIVPALGGAGLERKIASFGYYPQWSPDGTRILFQELALEAVGSRFYLVGLDGTAPHEVMAELTTRMATVSAAWHPDGKRVSVLVWDIRPSPVPNFWTTPVGGGAAVRSEISPELLKAGEAAAGEGIAAWGDSDFKFSWSPSGTAIYFVRTFRGARNVWRMNVDPQTLQGTGVERLTTGTGFDTQLSLSPKGDRLAFTGESQQVRTWMFPFDATRGHVKGPGEVVTSTGIEAWGASLSRDSKKLAFAGKRASRWELWEKSVVDGRETPIFTDDSYLRGDPQWSPDGATLIYDRMKSSTGEYEVMTWSRESHTEEPLTASSHNYTFVTDWSPDGKWLLTTQENKATGKAEIWKLPVVSARTKKEAQKIISDPGYDLFQGRLSFDGRWVLFEAVGIQHAHQESTIYVMATGGGPWIRITDGKQWDDKPRWSPDSKVIHYLSKRKGFFNVWGVHFDSEKGKPLGDPFQITTFDNPKLMVPVGIMDVDLSLTQDRLAVTVAEVSGSIWVLDNVDR